jgi:hypothetical protein
MWITSRNRNYWKTRRASEGDLPTLTCQRPRSPEAPRGLRARPPCLLSYSRRRNVQRTPPPTPQTWCGEKSNRPALTAPVTAFGFDQKTHPTPGECCISPALSTPTNVTRNGSPRTTRLPARRAPPLFFYTPRAHDPNRSLSTIHRLRWCLCCTKRICCLCWFSHIYACKCRGKAVPTSEADRRQYVVLRSETSSPSHTVASRDSP